MKYPISLLFCVLIFTTSCYKEFPHKLPIQHKSPNYDAQLKDSLWAYYPIQGNTNDVSGNNHVLSLKNGASLTYDKSGTDSSAIDFNGNENYAAIADGAFFPSTNAFSVSLVIMPRENKGLFFGKQDYSTAKAASFNVGIDTRISGDVARFSVTTNQSQICNQIPTGGNLLPNTKPFNLNAWYHVAITFKNGSMKLYINGSLVNTKMIDIQSINSCVNGQFILANWWTGDHNAFNGKMDDIRIYTRDLNATEVKYLFSKCAVSL